MAQVSHRNGYIIALSPFDLSFCNFAVDFRLAGEASWVRTAEVLLENQKRKSFRVFCLPGDQPEDIRSRLIALGFCSDHQLVQMASDGVAIQSLGLDLIESTATHERREVAEFMIRQFFWRQNPALRRQIIEATVRSPHRLVSYRPGGTLTGAAMIVETPDSHGLYNLCVTNSKRKKGLGKGIVEAIQKEAALRRVPCVLQCEPGLESWYASQGFGNFGKIHALSYR